MSSAGRNIRIYREQKGLTQDALAERLHVTRQTVSNWETGRNQPDLDMLEAAAKALDLEPADLLGGKKPEYPRFQRKAVAWVAVLAALTLFLLADRLFLDPWLLALRGRTFRVLPYALNRLLVLPFCRAAGGMLVPAAVSLRHSLQPEGRKRAALRIAAVLLLLPPALILPVLLSMTRTPVRIPLLTSFSLYILTDPTGFRPRLVQWVLPFLGGLCRYPGFVRLKRPGDIS